MPRQTADEIITKQHNRAYIQFGASGPENDLLYGGQDGQYMDVEGLSIPDAYGDRDPLWRPHPSRPKEFQQVGSMVSPPDIAEGTLLMYERHGTIPRQLGHLRCAFNLYINSGRCVDLSDPVAGWDNFVTIISNALVSGNKDAGDRTAAEDDEAIVDSIPFKADDIYAIGRISFGEKAATAIDREVVDAVYGTPAICYGCSTTDRIYAVTKSSGAGSPGLPAELVYTTNGGDSFSQTTITSFGANENPVAIDIVGTKLVILGDNAIYWAEINKYTGVPGTFTKIATGFVSGKTANDMFVLSPREVFFVGNGGYIYKASDITNGVSVINAGDTTTQNLYRIDGYGDVLMAVGAGSTVIRSLNRGQTWAATTASPSALPLDVLAVGIRGPDEYWVGTGASGRVFYSITSGETWVEYALPTSGTGNIRDIVWVTKDAGWIAHDNNDPTASIYSTWMGGRHWTRSEPRVANVPVFDRANRFAFPDADPLTASNHVAVAGLGGNGTDGIFLLGVGNIV